MKNKLYVIIDGDEIFAARVMDEDELVTAQEEARLSTDNFRWELADLKYGQVGGLLKDLHATLFDTIQRPYRIPCDCPPAQMDNEGNPIPSFSCVCCRLNRTVDEIYYAESKERELS